MFPMFPPQLMQIVNMVQSGGNPMAMMQSMFGNNPTFNMAMNMAHGKSPEQLQQTVKNLAKERGMSDEQLNQFLSQFGLKI